MSHPRHDEREILREEREILRDDREILHELHDIEHELHHLTGFTPIKEITMVSLAAGQTAIFGTTALPEGASPLSGGLAWTSSDTTNAPVSPNPADPSGLTTAVVFPSTVTAGLTFILSINYKNSDGTFASQANSFTTVAPPPLDITGFTPIVQIA